MRAADGKRPDGAQPHWEMRKRAAWSPHPSPASAPPLAPAQRELLLDELAPTLVERTKRLLGGNGRADLVVVPRVLRLGRLLHLDQVRRMDLAAVDTNRPLAEERIVGRQLLHLRDDLRALVALQRLDGLQVVQYSGIDAGVDHRGMDLTIALREPLGERARFLVHVPVERLVERLFLCLLHVLTDVICL